MARVSIPLRFDLNREHQNHVFRAGRFHPATVRFEYTTPLSGQVEVVSIPLRFDLNYCLRRRRAQAVVSIPLRFDLNSLRSPGARRGTVSIPLRFDLNSGGLSCPCSPEFPSRYGSI